MNPTTTGTEPTTVSVDIYGPNLPRPLCDLGDFHVHRGGCGHSRQFPEDTGPWTIDAADKDDVVYSTCGDIIAEDHGYDGAPYATEADALRGSYSQFYWAPCIARALPGGA